MNQAGPHSADEFASRNAAHRPQQYADREPPEARRINEHGSHRSPRSAEEASVGRYGGSDAVQEREREVDAERAGSAEGVAELPFVGAEGWRVVTEKGADGCEFGAVAARSAGGVNDDGIGWVVDVSTGSTHGAEECVSV